MALKSTIATKIFGLAVLLLCLTIALSAFLLWQVTRLNVQLKAIVGHISRSPVRRLISMNTVCAGVWPLNAGLGR